TCVTCTERMRHPGARRPRDDMPGADLDRFLLRLLFHHLERRRPELERRLALQEDEQLLVGRVAVRRRAVVAGFEPPGVHARVLRPGLAGEQDPASRPSYAAFASATFRG